MTPQELKSSILQLAIQGKLVEQRPEEGTGEELYRRIQAEKKRLIQEGKIKKEKPLPEIAEDEVPFEIPESWRWVRYSELMNSMSTGPFGSMLHKSDYVQNGIPLVNPANIVNGRITASNKMMVSAETAKRLESYMLQTGMIIMGRRGEMGRCAVVGRQENGWLCGTGSFFMMPTCHMYVHYISMLFSTPCAKGYLSGASVGTTMNNLNHKILSDMPVPLPPLAEQKRIVAKIEELLPYLDRYEKAWNRLEDFGSRFPADMQKSILQMAIQGKLVEQRPEEGTGEELYRQIQAEKQALIKAGKIKKEKPLPEIAEDEVPFEIPEGWKWVRLGQAIDMLSGFAFKSSDFKETGHYRLLRGINLGVATTRWDDTVYVDEMPKKLEPYRIQKGDVLIGLDRPWISDGIRVTIYNDEEQTYVVQRVLRVRETCAIIKEYIALLLRSNLFKSAVEGQTTGISVPHISPGQVGNVVIPLPPIAEQKRIVARLEEILPLCERLK